MLNVIMLNVIMLSVIILNVLAPILGHWIVRSFSIGCVLFHHFNIRGILNC